MLYPAFPRKVDPVSLIKYLFFEFIPSPHTIFMDAKKIPAASYLVWDDKAIEVKQYWSPFNLQKDEKIFQKPKQNWGWWNFSKSLSSGVLSATSHWEFFWAAESIQAQSQLWLKKRCQGKSRLFQLVLKTLLLMNQNMLLWHLNTLVPSIMNRWWCCWLTQYRSRASGYPWRTHGRRIHFANLSPF